MKGKLVESGWRRLRLTRQQRDKFRKIRRLQQLKTMDPIEFEKYCGFLYERSGYRAYMTVASGDEGVDLYLRKGMRSVVVQCKRYSGTVGQPTVRDLYGTMQHNKASGAVLVTTGRFSRAAEQWIKEKPIQLVDGHELMSWNRRLFSRAGAGHWRWQAGRLVRAAGWLLLGIVLIAAIVLGINRLDQSNGVAVATEPPPTATRIAPTATVPFAPLAGSRSLFKSNQPPEVDGRIVEWSEFDPTASAFVSAADPSWDERVDATAEWRLTWSSDGLFAAIIVEDDRLVPATSSEPLNGDGLELLIQIGRTDGLATQINGNSYRVLLLTGDFGQESASADFFQGNDNQQFERIFPNSIMVEARQTNVGYQYELMIPWDLLSAAPHTNQRISLMLLLSDADDSSIVEVQFAHLDAWQLASPSTWSIWYLK